MYALDAQRSRIREGSELDPASTSGVAILHSLRECRRHMRYHSPPVGSLVSVGKPSTGVPALTIAHLWPPRYSANTGLFPFVHFPSSVGFGRLLSPNGR